MVKTMSTGKEVSKKSAFPSNWDLSVVFKGILQIWISLQNDQNLRLVFLYSCDIIEVFHFLTASENAM